MAALLARLIAGPRRQSPGTWLAVATVLLAAGLFVYNNLSPYLGLHFWGPMTMFSGLTHHSDNHFLMPRIPLSDGDVFVAAVRLTSQDLETPAGRVLKTLVDWAAEERKLLNLNIVRYHASRACASAPDASIRLTLRTEDGRILDHRNVCTEPTMLRYVVLTSQPVCSGSGCDYFRRLFRSGRLPQ